MTMAGVQLVVKHFFLLKPSFTWYFPWNIFAAKLEQQEIWYDLQYMREVPDNSYQSSQNLTATQSNQ